MENAIAVTTETMFKEPLALGDIFAQSGMFPDIKTKAQAAVKILAGKELGLSPFESMASIYIVNGKLALTSKAMASLIKKNPKYDYVVESLDDKSCSIDFIKIEGEAKVSLGKSAFTFADAAKAGLVNKEVWKNYPRNLMFARALSNGARWYCPDAICGYYTVEEVEELTVEPPKTVVSISQEGEVKDGEA
jgi:hypothetical protein